jgi:hypothetical protein
VIIMVGLGLLGGILLGIGYFRGDLTFVAGGLLLIGLAVVAGAVWALRDNRRGRR